jgi:hypothetical protein
MHQLATLPRPYGAVTEDGTVTVTVTEEGEVMEDGGDTVDGGVMDTVDGGVTVTGGGGR